MNSTGNEQYSKVKSNSLVTPVILCGGVGSRLWPLSRESFPKQFIPLVDGKSLLELTINRVKALGSPFCVANEDHRFLIKDILTQGLGGINSREGYILLEPSGRNTAAAMASAALMPTITNSDLLLFLPSDHYIPDVNAFLETVEFGIKAALSGYIVTFGIQPSYPSTGYGYIQKGAHLDCLNEIAPSTYLIKSFVEKPSYKNAQDMLLAGNYFWNAGIFLCQASTLIDALSVHAPDILKSCQTAMHAPVIDGDFIRPEIESFLDCRADSIDYAVMEHFEKVAVVPFKGTWSDVGSWNAVASLSSPDKSGNRICGQGMTSYARNTYINAPHRPVVALGTSDLVIVDTPDAVLVATSDSVEQVKEVVAKLKENGVPQAVMHRRVTRPWGWYDSIDAGDRFQVKRIVVKSGASLSLQMHLHRAEHWIVVKGTAKVTNDTKVFLLEENQSTYIPIGVKHRLENPGKTDLEMIEVQSGGYLGEDDIVRFDDTYGRN